MVSFGDRLAYAMDNYDRDFPAKQATVPAASL
jgi:hypothetical protein